jgi:hypothetical protein
MRQQERCAGTRNERKRCSRTKRAIATGMKGTDIDYMRYFSP